jgi:hypothetical protein
MEQKFDNRQGYCRKLGHHLIFKYCREEHQGLPCPKIRDCWYRGIDIDQFLQQNYQKEEIDHLYNIPPAKIGTIIELIRQARKNNDCIQT